MWAATLAVVVLRTSGANFNTGVGIHDGTTGSVFVGTQLRINHAAFGHLSDLQMAEKKVERLHAGDVRVHGSAEHCIPDCSNCREPGGFGFLERSDNTKADPNEGGAGDANEEKNKQGADEACCIGQPIACGKCSEIIPESFYKAVGDPKITGTWRVTRCEHNGDNGLCDPCKPDRATEYESTRELYCKESEEAGRLMCYPRTPDKYQIRCNPGNLANAWYGGWEVKDKANFRSCQQR